MMKALVYSWLCLLFSLSAEAQNYQGRWLWDGAGPTIFRMTVNGDKVTGRIATSAKSGWDVAGKVDPTKGLELTRWIPISELPNTPVPVLNEVLKQIGDPLKPGFVKGQIVAKYNPANQRIEGYYTRPQVFYMGDTFIRLQQTPSNFFVTRQNSIDLEVTEFTFKPILGTEIDTDFADLPIDQHHFTAVIKNTSSSDMTAPVKVILQRSPFPEADLSKIYLLDVGNSEVEIRALKGGESITVEWSSDGSIGQKADLERGDEFVQVVVNPQGRDLEDDPANNTLGLYRFICWDEKSWPKDRVPLRYSAWMPMNPRDENLYNHRFDFKEITKHFPPTSEPVNQVLCYIQLEARKRAVVDLMTNKYTVAGSRGLQSLQTHFLADFWANRTQAKAQDAIDKIGEPQGFPGAYLGAALFIPQGLRDLYPAITDSWMYPATQFWIIRHPAGISRGNHIGLIPQWDVPFLVGGINNRENTNLNNAIHGGKNLSNVMHWATGVKYHTWPEDAMRALFLGYEYWHMEGWDVLAEDPINDLISEEQGRLLGIDLYNLRITNAHELVQAMDKNFRKSRAWVGAMIDYRYADLVRFVAADVAPQTHMWFQRYDYYAPWGNSSAIETIKQRFAKGETLDTIIHSSHVEQLINIFEVVYASREWQKIHGTVTLHPTIIKTLNGVYDGQFRTAPKDHLDEWVWDPR